MTRRDWWLGVAAVVMVVLFHAMFPRYDWRTYGTQSHLLVRVDRWTGTAALGYWTDGRWTPMLPAPLVDQALDRK